MQLPRVVFGTSSDDVAGWLLPDLLLPLPFVRPIPKPHHVLRRLQFILALATIRL